MLNIFFYILFVTTSIFVETSPFFKRGFIVNNATMFAMHEIHSANGQSSEYVYVHIPSSIIESFAVDANLDIIFFVDSENNLLMEHNINSRKNRMLTSVSSAKGINYLWNKNHFFPTKEWFISYIYCIWLTPILYRKWQHLA